MSDTVTVYIEIERDSNVKYEFDKVHQKLMVDRILPYPYYYPYAYGFIPNTLAMDNDELDILVITDKILEKNTYHNAVIVGVLVMEDEKGMDEKVLCVLEEDSCRGCNGATAKQCVVTDTESGALAYDSKITDITELSKDTLYNIHWFFSNYKNKTENRWSNVIGFENKEFAVELYNKSLV